MPNNGSSSERLSTESSREKVRFLVNATEKNELGELRSNVNELSNEVQVAVGDLKKSIADIRSTVSEMENPFNLLRTGSSENDTEKLNEARLPSGVKSIILGKPEENTISDESLSQQKTELVPQIETVTNEKPNISPQSITPLKPIRASAYIDWIWELLDTGLTAENIRQLANLCEMTNYLPKQASEFIYHLAATAEKIRLIGFTKGHLVLFLYKAATLSKTNIDPEDMQALIDITEQQLKNVKSE